ncbi:MAG TPA: hypothetical protein VMX16_13845 [Terriglobia bacterium]|nr:hypothetical protein [Terriglobia bacterium]
MDKVTTLNVNGVTHTVNVVRDTSLLTVLRVHLNLTGSKYGSGRGQCHFQRHGNPAHVAADGSQWVEDLAWMIHEAPL